MQSDISQSAVIAVNHPKYHQDCFLAGYHIARECLMCFQNSYFKMAGNISNTSGKLNPNALERLFHFLKIEACAGTNV